MRANSQAVHANLQRVYAALKTVGKQSNNWNLRSDVYGIFARPKNKGMQLATPKSNDIYR